ncbi:DUF4194 domain-containing protein [Brevibacterium metallidurans]|uniref:DUF4194 domain-containing protein n=1 Tax=Brevibacterium metallidurans TaxID=1482676 RepID=A0ABN0SJE3_9MICO
MTETPETAVPDTATPIAETPKTAAPLAEAPTATTGQAAGASDADDWQAHGNPSALWTGDTGTLGQNTRRVILELLKGPYVSGTQSPQLWAALVADEGIVRSRLHELFLDLVIDKVDEFAFTRKVVTDELDVPAAVRSERLTFLDTAMLLVLRQLLLAAPGERRVIVDREEVYERLAIYRTGDESTFVRNLNGAWGRMSNRLRVLHKAGEDRFEISPMVKFLIDEDQVRELIDVYERIAGTAPTDAEDPAEATDPTEATDPADAPAPDPVTSADTPEDDA